MSLRRAALAAILTLAMAAPAVALPDLKDWPAIATAAQGDTVRLGIAGGSAGQQRFLDWAGGELERLYDIRLEIVDFPSQRTLIEALGAEDESRIDLAALGSRAVAEARRAELLPERYAYRLPNWHFVDRAGTPSVIFAAGLPTHYSAVPWGKRSVTLFANGAATSSRPDSPAALLTYARAKSGPVCLSRSGDGRRGSLSGRGSAQPRGGPVRAGSADRRRGRRGRHRALLLRGWTTYARFSGRRGEASRVRKPRPATCWPAARST